MQILVSRSNRHWRPISFLKRIYTFSDSCDTESYQNLNKKNLLYVDLSFLIHSEWLLTRFYSLWITRSYFVTPADSFWPINLTKILSKIYFDLSNDLNVVLTRSGCLDNHKQINNQNIPYIRTFHLKENFQKLILSKTKCFWF